MKNTSAKKRILLVGDDMDTCLTFKRLLEEQDWNFTRYDRNAAGYHKRQKFQMHGRIIFEP
jgi:hypothetical protein